MITQRDQRIAASGAKILPPFRVDPGLCLYSPQDNVDALAHPRVSAWLDFVRHRYEPQATDATRVLVFLPCTATKPYIASKEHQAINTRLIEAGFEPAGEAPSLPESVLAAFDDPAIGHLGPLRRGSVELARVVMSEPLGFVPYEHLTEVGDEASPAVSYDDPGLFEQRGTSVSPWRADSTAVQAADGSWRWGPNEKRAYVAMHNEMAAVVRDVLTRLAGHYAHALAWVAPGLTHRSFCLARHERRDHGVVASRRVEGRSLALEGVNDGLDDTQRIEVLPTPQMCDDARRRLRDRIGGSQRSANAMFARGGGGATPLALPEMLDSLISRLDDFS